MPIYNVNAIDGLFLTEAVYDAEGDNTEVFQTQMFVEVADASNETSTPIYVTQSIVEFASTPYNTLTPVHVTQSIVEWAETVPPIGTTVQVTQSIVELAISDAPYAYDQLNCTDSAAVADTPSQIATDTLTCSDTATALVGAIYNVSTTDTLACLDEAYYSIDSDDSMSCTDTATVCVAYTVSDTLTCTDSAAVNVKLVDVITLSDSVESCSIICASVTDVLVEAVEVYDPNTNTLSLIQVGLTDEALRDTSHEPIHTSTDTLTCSDTATASTSVFAPDSLNCTDTAEACIAQAGRDQLSCSDQANIVIDYAPLEVADTLTCSDSFSYLLCEVNPDCPQKFKYAPNIGSTTDPNAPAPPPSEYAPEGVTSGFRLQYPATDTPVDELELRDPNFGNRCRFAPHRINQETRGGDLILFADPIWPTVQSQQFTFSVLKKEQAAEVLAWHDKYLGKQIRLIDHEDREWVGILVEVNDPIVQDRRQSWSTSFAFEGTKV